MICGGSFSSISDPLFPSHDCCDASRFMPIAEVVMETIEDIRARFGNPHAGSPDGPVQPINWAFRYPDAGLRIWSLVVAVLGFFVTLCGVWTLVVPISAIGIGLLAAAVVMFGRAEYIARHREDFVNDEPRV
jgi:hypothetical protein